MDYFDINGFQTGMGIAVRILQNLAASNYSIRIDTSNQRRESLNLIGNFLESTHHVRISRKLDIDIKSNGLNRLIKNQELVWTSWPTATACIALIKNLKGLNNDLVADPERSIICMNKSLAKVLMHFKVDEHKALPSFDVFSPIDRFHKHSEHQKNLLANLTCSQRVQIKAGRCFFLKIAKPRITEDGEMSGFLAEWVNTTDNAALLKPAADQVLEERAVESDSVTTLRFDLGRYVSRVPRATPLIVTRTKPSIRLAASFT